MVRKRYKHLIKCATMIQSLYRGFRQRKLFHNFVELTVETMRASYYDLQATKIQSVFRGYMSRKTIHNFYARKKYLEMVVLQNQIVKDHLHQYKCQQAEEKSKLKAVADEKQIIYQARKTHYLLSTTQISGVYDPRVKNGKRREPMEQMLKTVAPLGKLERKPKLPAIGEQSSSSEHAKIVEKARRLPQPQGPFRKTRESVIEQRYRQLNPSLRVSEPYETHIDEARQQLRFDDMMKRIKADRFLPVMKCRDEPHQQLLHTTSPYGHINYGNKHFRAYKAGTEIQSPKNTRFRTVVSPIPFFDKYLADNERAETFVQSL